jgi:hypothetical protein
MTFIVQLQKAFLVEVLCEWTELQALVHFDTALCNHFDRLELQALYKQPSFSINNSETIDYVVKDGSNRFENLTMLLKYKTYLYEDNYMITSDGLFWYEKTLDWFIFKMIKVRFLCFITDVDTKFQIASEKYLLLCSNKLETIQIRNYVV